LHDETILYINQTNFIYFSLAGSGFISIVCSTSWEVQVWRCLESYRAPRAASLSQTQPHLSSSRAWWNSKRFNQR